ncbi:winged helix DNA-binding protein [Kribbella steppae]|uniref:Winged helix DNA-binding protein n=1 Tax=Kribbella steppae TaxID=2512223 RepID=A0A4R2GW35_9ACTN|nr:crosslink repair DNA glycosylase YcaQ family protein [Kribbella steppae]TCO14366.1 winged helix DNA-binding protein [Kribbella steppae]
MRVVTREQAVSYRLHVNHLTERLSAGSHEEAAYVGLQDTAPRDALLGLHARVADCKPSDWADPCLIQTYSPRAAVYVLPRKDFGVFTLGRLPLATEAIRRVDRLADTVCRTLDGRELRGGLPDLREACSSGRIALRWTTSSLWVREVPRPEIDLDEARKELCRRHVHRFAPTNPRTFAWWAGLAAGDAREIWNSLADELLEVDFDGTPGWILRADEQRIREAPPARGVRLLVEPDLRLLGRDLDGRFIAPGKRTLTPAADTFHPNGVLVDGRIVGAWGRKGAKVDVVLTEQLTPLQDDALAAEVAAFPISGARLVAPVGGEFAAQRPRG